MCGDNIPPAGASRARPLDAPMNQLTPRKPSGAQPGNRNAIRLNPKVRAAIAYRFTNPNASNLEACKAVGCPERTFYKAKRSPHFREHFTQLGKDGLLDLVPNAIGRMADILKDPKASPYVVADIAKDVTAQAGVRERLDGAARPAGIGSITINIGGRPGEQVRIEAQDVVHNGSAARPEDERTD